MSVVSNKKIAVIGLGYVGLPLARLFSTKYKTIGYDINKNRTSSLMKGFDETNEISDTILSEAIGNGLFCTSDINDIKDCNIYIVAVPTPIDKNKTPNLGPLLKASETVGKVIKKGDIVIYESTVYPGATEEDCVPIIEKESSLKFNVDFFAGYSPERINPGDKVHTIEKIKKVTSGSTTEIALEVDNLYKSVIEAGTYLAPSIKVAEASKIIENSQRDINIAFMNEISKIFNRMGIKTSEALKAAESKWNFQRFTPGLVGGHCIGVDSYYLIHKAAQFGYNSDIMVSGRRVNDSMGEYVGSEVVKCMIRKDLAIKGTEVLILGITFKENCPDVRSTKVIDVISTLKEFGLIPIVVDPLASPEDTFKTYGVKIKNSIPNKKFKAVVLAVPHSELLKTDIRELVTDTGVIYDVKGVLPYNTDGGL